jgi:hypothetical protein
MAAQILPFPTIGGPASSPVACFLRVGEAHRKLAELHAAGHLRFTQAVFEVSRLRHQHELVAAMRDSGARIVLDTEAAELASPARCGGHSRRAPWAPEGGGLLGPSCFRGSALEDFVSQAARFAVENRVHTILAPTHFLGDPGFRGWLAVDRDACLALRRALDREGGGQIAIDYPVILPNTMLNDSVARGTIISTLSELPIENAWVRASGFGADAGPLAAKRYLTSIAGFHNLGKPVIADYLGGLIGQAALAFGAVSGIALCISERERFDARDSYKAPEQSEENGPFGRTVRVLIPGLDKSVTRKELEVLASVSSGRRLCGCNDRTCCPRGYTDMVADPRGHTARRLMRSITSLEAVPDLRREADFLNGPMAEADRRGREIKALRPLQSEAALREVRLDELMKRLAIHSHHVESLRASLEHLHETRGVEAPRARPIQMKTLAERKSGSHRP